MPALHLAKINLLFSMHPFKINMLALLFAALIINQDAFSQQFLRTDGQRIVNEKGENVLLRGMGLGGWMLQEGYMLKVNKDGQQYRIRQRIDSLIGTANTNEFYDKWLANHTQKSDIDSLKNWGFNSVRLPMHFNLYTLPVDKEPTAGNNTWLEKGFQLTDSLLAWCRSNQLYLILDLHAAPGGQGNDANISDRDKSKPSLWDSEANQQKTVALWKKLAERYANEPWIAGYDIINEPNWGFDDIAKDPNGLGEKHNTPLKKLMMEITKAIRLADKKHIIIIEGNGWGNNYNGVLPVWDDNMVLSFHKYWNFNDQQSIQHILDMRAANNIPVWLGETGENSNVWFTEAIHLLESNNIGWAWWPLKKIGSNNPLEIRSNPDYQQVVSYLNGKGAKPSPVQAYKGLMKLTESLKTANNIFHRDVVDAMFRQPFADEAIPFKHFIVNGKGTLKAVDYDLGKIGIAYFDKDSADYHISNGSNGGNEGRVYRNDGVDIQKDKANAFYYVSDIEKGEWLQYTIDVKKQGNYAVDLVCLPGKTAGSISLSVDNQTPKAVVKTPATGGLAWQDFAAGSYALSTGLHTIKVYFEAGGFNFKEIRFSLK